MAEYDVAIAGVGLAGSYASLYACRYGLNVLALDGKAAPGGRVRCGEFIPSLVEAKRFLPSVTSMDELYSLIPKEAIVNRTRTIRFLSPDNRRYEFAFDGLVLDRSLLERSIVEKALRNGLTFKASFSLSRVASKDDQLELEAVGRGEVLKARAKVLVGADGYPSRVATSMGMETGYGPSDLALAVQSLMVNVNAEEDVVQMYSGIGYAYGCYAWIIPKGGRLANVGLGVRLTLVKRVGRNIALDLLKLFITKHPVASKALASAKPLNLVAKLVPVGGMVKEIVKGRALLAGDAAGLVVAINGSGIPLAMVSGRHAGEVAALNVEEGLPLRSYEEALRKELGDVVNRSLKYRRASDFLMRSDRLFSLTLRVIGTSGISRILKCEHSIPLSVLTAILSGLSNVIRV